jgi:hypothetical protein
MIVGEIGFVIKMADGTYVGRSYRRGAERMFLSWREADRARRAVVWDGGRRKTTLRPEFEGSTIEMVTLVPVKLGAQQ